MITQLDLPNEEIKIGSKLYSIKQYAADYVYLYRRHEYDKDEKIELLFEMQVLQFRLFLDYLNSCDRLFIKSYEDRKRLQR